MFTCLHAHTHTHTHTQPSSTILQSLLSLHSKDKAYSKLAEVVKKAQVHGVKLDKDFYQKSLVELRHWGQDQEAISAVYKALRKVQSSAKVLEGDSAIHVDNQICDTNNPSQVGNIGREDAPKISMPTK